MGIKKKKKKALILYLLMGGGGGTAVLCPVGGPTTFLNLFVKLFQIIE